MRLVNILLLFVKVLYIATIDILNFYVSQYLYKNIVGGIMVLVNRFIRK